MQLHLTWHSIVRIALSFQYPREQKHPHPKQKKATNILRYSIIENLKKLTSIWNDDGLLHGRWDRMYRQVMDEPPMLPLGPPGTIFSSSQTKSQK
jgi:hypothetical protein